LVKSSSLAQKRRRRRRRKSPERAKKGRGPAPFPAQAPVAEVPAGPAVPVQVRARRGRFLVSSLLRFFRLFKWMPLPFKSKFYIFYFFPEFGT
jgi:hypothetical protein